MTVEADAGSFEVRKGTGGVKPLTDADRASLPLPTRKEAAVTQFVPAGQVDPLSYGPAYYLWPADKAGSRAYALLRDAMAKAGIVKVAIRQRGSVAALTVRGDVMVMHMLLWPDEVRDVPEVETPEPSEAEQDMAMKLVAAFSGDFDPADYHDQRREALEKVVEAKIIQADKPEQPAAAQPTVSNLEAALAAKKEAA